LSFCSILKACFTGVSGLIRAKNFQCRLTTTFV
jgi:hypothetical protein